MNERSVDIVVIGAGVAGLAAAVKLAAHRRRVVVLEARDRAGGRIHTEHIAGWPRPVELGAEFVHTGNAALWRWIKRAGLKAQPIDEGEWLSRGGSLKPVPGAWDRVNAVMGRIGPRFRGSYAEWLAEHRDEVPADDQVLATAMVKGFQGAWPEKMSAHALFLASKEEEEQRRLVGGYGTLVDAMVDAAVRRQVDLVFTSPVRTVRWRTGAVRVTAAGGNWTARAVLVTVPLGVWRAPVGEPGAIEFLPALREKQRIVARLQPGHAVRVVHRMRADIWCRGPLPSGLRARSGHAFGFVQSAEPFFPVWWAEAPAPILVGWTGGPGAAAMAGWGGREVCRRAEESLGRVLLLDRDRLRHAIVDRRTYDWGSDPHTRGAYSFATAGAEALPARLARPVRRTLYFAGEATADLLELGTVHGALASGERAAQEILRNG